LRLISAFQIPLHWLIQWPQLVDTTSMTWNSRRESEFRDAHIRIVPEANETIGERLLLPYTEFRVWKRSIS